MPARTLSSLEEISSSIPKIFDQAQVSTANHQKNYVALYKLHLEASKHTEPINKGRTVKHVGQKAFEDVVVEMTSRLLPLKKGTTVADRIVKFIGGYVRFMNEKVLEERKKNGGDADEYDDTPASRFASRMLKFLLKGFLAKDKNVRYRVVQILAEVVSHMGELDEDLYTQIRESLLDRLRDKEPFVRVQAVIGLAKLYGTEDPADLEDGEPPVVEVLLDTLAHDPSGDVRRAVLVNVHINQATLSYILARSRDTDAIIRKLFYTLLESNCVPPDDSNGLGITDPRVLSIAQRELIVRNGLGDREPSVRSAAAKLIVTWLEVVGEKMEGDEPAKEVIAFLRLFDLAETGIAEDALRSVFASRVDIFDNVEFGDQYWADLTPEKAFLARVFVDHCISTKDDARLESALPVVTLLAFRIQSTYNDLMEQIQDDEEQKFLRGEDHEDDEERARKEDERMDKEFVIGEMLRLAVNLDYADEIGRRKMFQLVRDMISQETLPESLLSRCLDVLRKLSPNERDLIRLVVEVVHELRDPEMEEKEASAGDDGETTYAETPMTVRTVRAAPKPPSEMTPEEKAQADAIDLRCLALCIGMLERVNGTFEENSTLEGILGELIIPAVKRKELALREKGLVSLGLCCLIARRMALNSFQLFLSQVQSAPELLKIRVLQIIFDILMVHDRDFLGNEGVAGDRIIEFLLQIWGNEESEKVQALMCVGIAKLMLSGMVTDERVLKSLVFAYVSPETAGNQELRQCLSYFFPVYCYSSPANQRRMQKIFIPIFEELSQVYKELDDDREMISPANVVAMFVDWTDPQKAVAVRGQAADDKIHFDMATEIVRTLYSKDMEKDEKKVLCQSLSKLYIPDVVDDDQIRTLKLLMHNLASRRPLKDTTANNALTRFDAAISKKFEKQLEDFDEEQYRELESLKELFEFLDDIIPESDEDEQDTPVPKKRATRKRRSQSVASTATAETTDREESATPSAENSRKGKGKKRARLSTETDTDSNATEEIPSRAMPARTARTKAKSKVAAQQADRDESTPEPPSRKRASKKAEEARLDEEIDGLLDGDEPDSIMDSDEDEEEEVGELLEAE
ncbi:chromosome condensation complex protein [Gloeophyllum trabeum ATCC 11539]|uniref:Chromosome condensation complex protein n=1 Tax=Gloeophyllum trabeum (strain ATCC 11539 / FP-39264 / Madison 617) TaxID=670483 RepID=S7RIG0_GLOTA|nr:chromosome condensation complex protein [Gloeophyllum trabeum ATCC 11539]EPQ52389.1 chromosome condensation complex protein [Gloeophyllum trabeum ATCC 11539]